MEHILTTICRQNNKDPWGGSLGLPRVREQYDSSSGVITIRFPRDEQHWMGVYVVEVKFKDGQLRKYQLVAPNGEAAEGAIEFHLCARYERFEDVNFQFVERPHVDFENLEYIKAIETIKEPMSMEEYLRK